MKTIFLGSFLRDLKRIKESELKDKVSLVIKRVEAAVALNEIGNVKKMQGTEGNF